MSLASERDQYFDHVAHSLIRDLESMFHVRPIARARIE
jgi:hypothetical protein